MTHHPKGRNGRATMVRMAGRVATPRTASTQRHTLAVTTCVAPLRVWIGRGWYGQPIALALTATTLCDRFVALTRPPATIRCTVIWFWVNVPVLSEQITVVLPSVSTAGNLRMIACRRAICTTPIASVTVTAAGNPSGMALTASAT